METKICNICNEAKTVDCYYIQGKTKKGKNKIGAACSVCVSAKRRELYRQNKVEAIFYKGGSCNDCGQVYHQSVFEFHHLDSATKIGQEPSDLIKNGIGLSDRAKIELDKCVMLCANCHRIRHFTDLI